MGRTLESHIFSLFLYFFGHPIPTHFVLKYVFLLVHTLFSNLVLELRHTIQVIMLCTALYNIRERLQKVTV